MKGPWEDKYDDIVQEGIEPTDYMVDEALEEDRRDSYED